MDSTLILQYFEMQAEPGRKLLANNPHRLAEDLQLLGFILAASEKGGTKIFMNIVSVRRKKTASAMD